MKYPALPLWKEAPFIRYIIPLSAGIFVQWYHAFTFTALLCGLTGCTVLIIIFSISRLSWRFYFSYIFGWSFNLLLFFMGSLLVYVRDERNKQEWIGRKPLQESILLVRIEEPLSEKPRSYRALAIVEKMIVKDRFITVNGRVILYLGKDGRAAGVKQGHRLLMKATLSPIKNFPNATGFDYRSYCALQNIYHQSFLKRSSYLLLPGREEKFFGEFLFFLRERTLRILRTYVTGKKEAGMAEALLIGYKDDLDKTLVQSYVNTGVVHVIAISGLHVGLIYTILLLVLRALPRGAYTRWAKPVILLAALWVFSLLAGGSPSVLRSAVMFSGIVLGKSLGRKNGIYNSLAASAFLLLCYNPLWLFDAGFQLSYLAVLSLVIFMNPLYNILYVQNKLLDGVWKMAAVTLAAQVLTVPICLYYFQQFPNLFLLTNMVAVPLSSVILVMEIALCTFSFYPPLAHWTGYLTERLIFMLNGFIEYMEKMPFALTKNLVVSFYQVMVLYGIILLSMQLIRIRTKKD